MYLVVCLTKCSRETFCYNLFRVPCNFLLNSLAYDLDVLQIFWQYVPPGLPWFSTLSLLIFWKPCQCLFQNSVFLLAILCTCPSHQTGSLQYNFDSFYTCTVSDLLISCCVFQFTPNIRRWHNLIMQLPIAFCHAPCFNTIVICIGYRRIFVAARAVCFSKCF